MHQDEAIGLTFHTFNHYQANTDNWTDNVSRLLAEFTAQKKAAVIPNLQNIGHGMLINYCDGSVTITPTIPDLGKTVFGLDTQQFPAKMGISAMIICDLNIANPHPTQCQLVFFAPEDYHPHVYAHLTSHTPELIVDSNTDAGRQGVAFFSLEHVVTAVMPRPKMYVGNTGALVKFLFTNTNEPLDQVFTAAGFAFPHVKGMLSTNCEVMRIQPNNYQNSALLNVYDAAGDADRTEYTYCAVAYWLMVYAYSQDATIVNQLEKRINAALSGCLAKPIRKDIIQTLHNNNHTFRGQSNPLVNDVIGRIIAIDKLGKYNPEVKVEDLMAPTDLARRSNLSLPMEKLYEQLRLVWANNQQTTLKFIEDYMPVFIDQKILIHSGWNEEVDLVDTMLNIIRNAPYASIVPTLRADLHNKKFPRIALLAVKFHEERVKGTEEAATFAKYATNALAKNVARHDDILQIDAMIGMLNIRDLSIYAKMLTEKTYEEAELQFTRRELLYKDEIKAILLKDYQTCPWSARVLEERQAKQINDFITTSVPEMRRQIENVLPTIRKRYHRLYPNETVAEIDYRVMTIRAELEELVASFANTKTLITTANRETFTTIAPEIMMKFTTFEQQLRVAQGGDQPQQAAPVVPME